MEEEEEERKKKRKRRRRRERQEGKDGKELILKSLTAKNCTDCKRCTADARRKEKAGKMREREAATTKLLWKRRPRRWKGVRGDGIG